MKTWLALSAALLPWLPSTALPDEDNIGRASALAPGIAPDWHVLLPEADVKRLAEFGEAVPRRSGDATHLASRHTPTDYNAAAALDTDPSTCRSPTDANHAVLMLDLDRAVTIDRALTMGRRDESQHARGYASRPGVASAGTLWPRPRRSVT